MADGLMPVVLMGGIVLALLAWAWWRNRQAGTGSDDDSGTGFLSHSSYTSDSSSSSGDSSSSDSSSSSSDSSSSSSDN
jgi:hypothetical protein